MRKKLRSKIIQVPIDQGLLSHIDETAGMVSESRAEFIREACRDRLRSLAIQKLDRRYVDGYRRRPEDSTPARVNARLLAKVLPSERW
jgi:hypothetical protein